MLLTNYQTLVESCEPGSLCRIKGDAGRLHISTLMFNLRFKHRISVENGWVDRNTAALSRMKCCDVPLGNVAPQLLTPSKMEPLSES